MVTHITLEQLYEQAKAIDPDVQFVIHERIVGNYPKPDEFWAHSKRGAFSGDTPEEMLADLLASVKTKAVA